MNVLMVEPGKVPYETDIGDGLEAMQKAVGGCIQAVYPYEESVALVCNEEGKIEGLPLNRALRTEDGEIYDIIAGKFFICGLGEENFCSITPELAEKFKEKFKHPETFTKLFGKIMAVQEPIPGESSPDKSHKGPEL